MNNSGIYISDKEVTLFELEDLYGYNFAIQNMIKQHPVMAAPHPYSVNTLRMVTLRWKNKIHYLLTFARFGADKSVKDNAGAGGVCLGVKDNGEFYSLAVDEKCYTYSIHPTTKYRFSDMGKIPNFDDYKQFVVDLHKDVLHHDFISWDIAVGQDGRPVFIEANFAGATWLYQMSSQRPLFGELTEEILQHISSELAEGTKRDITNRKKDSNINKTKSQNRKLKRQLKNIEAEFQEELSSLKHKLMEKEKELKEMKKQQEQMKNSRFWRFTAPLRKKK